jgi:hypothetical protein
MMSFLESRQQVAPQGIGKPVRRREDARFLTGAGRYADDMNLPGQAYAYVVRSPHAHARIAGIDVGPAAGAPGILAVLTGRDATADGLQPIPHRPVPTNPHEVPLKSRDGSPFFTAPHPVLALGKTRYVGEPVAVVVAETLWLAMDALLRPPSGVELFVALFDAASPLVPATERSPRTRLCKNRVRNRLSAGGGEWIRTFRHETGSGFEASSEFGADRLSARRYHPGSRRPRQSQLAVSAARGAHSPPNDGARCGRGIAELKVRIHSPPGESPRTIGSAR